jgi:hypothetical protein
VSSTFFCSRLNKDSVAALSQAAPTRPMEPTRSLLSSSRRTFLEPNWLPRSECRIVPAGLRSAPAVADACSATDPASATDVTIPMAGRAEVLDGCWCCAPIDGTCTPRTKSGQGQAFLASCFE